MNDGTTLIEKTKPTCRLLMKSMFQSKLLYQTILMIQPDSCRFLNHFSHRNRKMSLTLNLIHLFWKRINGITLWPQQVG